MKKISGFIILILLLIIIFFATITNLGRTQIGGEIFVDRDNNQAQELANFKTAVSNLSQDNFRSADYTDANLSQTDVNTIINGIPYVNMANNDLYFTGSSIDGIGNFTVDGVAEVQGQVDPNRINLVNP